MRPTVCLQDTYPNTKYDEYGNIFLDEDANAFATLLNYLRTFPQGTFYDYSCDLPIGFATQMARKFNNARWYDNTEKASFYNR